MHITVSEYYSWITYKTFSNNDHHQARQKHAKCLEHIGSDDSFYPAQAGVEDADNEGDQDGQVHLQASHLSQGQAGAVHYDSQI